MASSHINLTVTNIAKVRNTFRRIGYFDATILNNEISFLALDFVEQCLMNTYGSNEDELDPDESAIAGIYKKMQDNAFDLYSNFIFSYDTLDNLYNWKETAVITEAIYKKTIPEEIWELYKQDALSDTKNSSNTAIRFTDLTTHLGDSWITSILEKAIDKSRLLPIYSFNNIDNLSLKNKLKQRIDTSNIVESKNVFPMRANQSGTEFCSETDDGFYKGLWKKDNPLGGEEDICYIFTEGILIGAMKKTTNPLILGLNNIYNPATKTFPVVKGGIYSPTSALIDATHRKEKVNVNNIYLYPARFAKQRDTTEGLGFTPKEIDERKRELAEKNNLKNYS